MHPPNLLQRSIMTRVCQHQPRPRLPLPTLRSLPFLLHLSLLLILLPSPATPQSGYTQVGLPWTSQYQQGTQPAPWPGRYGASAAVTGTGNVVLLGGLSISLNSTKTANSSYTLYNDAQLSSNVGATFSPTVTAAFSPRFFHASALTSAGSILLIGGFTMSSGAASSISSLRDTWYSSDGLAWSQGSQMPWPRGRGGHDVDADTASLIFYVTCGYTQDPAQPNLIWNDVWRTPDAGNTWQIATVNAPFSPRAFHGGLVRQGALFIVGGATWVGGAGWTACNDVWVSYDQGNTWAAQLSTTSLSFLNRFLQVSLSYNNDDLFFMAGMSIPQGFNLVNPLVSANVTVYSDVWESTDAGQSWQQTNPTSVFLPRFSASAVILGQDLVLFGGVNAQAVMLQDVWMTVLPLDATSSSGTVVAAIVGTLSGILMVVFIVVRRLQSKFVAGKSNVVVSGRTEQQLMAENRQQSSGP